MSSRDESDSSMNYPQFARLRRALAPADSSDVLRAHGRTPAAVLVPLFFSRGELNLLFIRRSDRLQNNPGQVAFPGGHIEPPESALAAALREAEEEVGLSPAAVSVLGRLRTNFTLTSRFVVTPFVAAIPVDAALRPDDREVAEIFSVPVTALRDPAFRGTYRWERNGEALDYPAVFYHGRTIWGLTLRITEDLMTLL